MERNLVLDCDFSAMDAEGGPGIENGPGFPKMKVIFIDQKLLNEHKEIMENQGHSVEVEMNAN